MEAVSAAAELEIGLPGDYCLRHRPGLRFRFRRTEKCLRHALVHRPLLRTALATASVVGTVLTLINQGTVLLAGEFPHQLYWKIPLTYSVPFLVSTWAALRISMVRSDDSVS